MPSINIPISGFDENDYAYYQVSSSYPLSNTIGSTARGGTKYSGLNLTRNYGAATYIYMLFDTSEIPQNAIIKSVTGQVRIYGSSTSQNRTTAREIQFFTGKTEKGSAVDFTMTGSATITEIPNNDSWTREELSDLRIRLYVTRNSSNTTSNTYVYWLGGDVTIEYEEGIPHSITTQVGDNTEVSETSATVFEGMSYSLEIFPSDGGQVRSITDNSKDVLSRLVKKSNPAGSSTISSYPTSYETSGNTISGTRYRNCIGYGSSNTASGSDYVNSSGRTATIYYSFDFSSLPEDAIIESVSVRVGGHAESTTNSNRKSSLQLYAGSTAKGEEVSFTSTSKQVLTMTPGTWTRDELQEAKLGFTIGYYGGLVNGVDFDVTYSLPNAGKTYYIYTISSVAEDHIILINMETGSPVFYIKLGGVQKGISAVYQKINGVWVEKQPSDLDRSAHYKKA